MTHLSDEQIENGKCYDLGLDAEQCQYEKDWNQLAVEEKMTIPRHGGEIIECRADECSLGYFIYDNPQFTVDAILDLYGYTT